MRAPVHPILDRQGGSQRGKQVGCGMAARACNVLLIYPRFAANTFWNFAATCELFGVRYPMPKTERKAERMERIGRTY